MVDPTPSPDLSDIPFQIIHDQKLTQKAYDLQQAGSLEGRAYRAPEQVIVTRVQGPCPRCGHPLDDQQTHTAVTNLTGGAGRRWGLHRHAPSTDEQAVFPVDVTCDCHHAHPGAGEARGCGASFRIEVPFTDTSTG